MATISTVTDTTIFQIKRWLGLHESPEGDTRLKLGEAAELRNWRITSEGSLQIRKGTEMVRKFGARSNGDWVGTPIMGMWHGFLYDQNHLLVATGGKVYDVNYNQTTSTTDYMNDHFDEWDVTELGDVQSGEHVEFMPYNGVIYVLDGNSLQKWDGHSASLDTVSGYVPIILVGCSCSTGAGSMLEETNLLNAKRIMWYTVSAEEAAQASLTFNFQEHPFATQDMKNAIVITNRATGVAYAHDTYVTFETELIDSTEYITGVTLGNGAVIPNGPNVIAIEYDMSGVDGYDFRSEIVSNRYWEFYNGENDNRVFLYGNGSNICYYSGLDGAGNPTAEYWPAMNQIAIGESNTPITGIIRHFTKLLCFKTTSTYSISFSNVVLDDQSVKAGFYYKPTNRELGNDALGQVRLVNNNAVTLCNGNILLWRSSSSDGSLTYDERQAKIMSDRVDNTVKTFDLKSAYCYDCNYDTEYYVCQGGNVLVYNYGLDVWYKYSNLHINAIVEIDHTIYMGMADGSIRRFTRNARGDYKQPRIAEVFDGTNPLTNLPYGGSGEEKWYTKYYYSSGHTMRRCYVQYGLPYADATGTLLSANTPVLIDDGIEEIDAFWRSGTLSFDRDWKRKISMVMWLNVLPESDGGFYVRHVSDRRASYPEKIISFPSFGFANINFNAFDFGALRWAKAIRVKMRVKKYVFYQLIMESKSKTATATILDADIQVRYWANVKAGR